MTDQIMYLIIAAVLGGMFFIIPQMLRLRIKVLNSIHWHSLANWHERNFDILVKALRGIFIVLIITLVIFAAW